ncbi:unnamed protein product [Clonostachys rosea]|uniref:Uncharacterized protein n=1 Tax=Bionectria ochroleuca TaxID=29856 RepID=A0ABY6TVJ7_BIOOC|nr:unnamed protein product [Clonostachys rosea]
MATAQLDALSDIQAAQKGNLQAKYGNRMSNQFVDEVKGAALFQFNWGELLGAAPTAISMMCACYVAATNDAAEKITLKDAMPEDGFKYLTRRSDPTLRACLIDVCNAGGREAFTIAGENMESLKQNSNKIVTEHIPGLFEALEVCMESEDNLDDFRRVLKRFAKEANACAGKAKEIKMAFNKWGLMVVELHGTTEQKSGQTSIEASKTVLDKQLADIESTFAEKKVKSSTDAVQEMSKSLERAEKRLDRAMDNVPGPLATIVNAAASSFAQAIPAITAAAIPIALAAANPMGAVAAGAMGPMKLPPGAVAPAGTGNVQATTQPLANDPASAAAYQSAHLFTTMYSYLGDDAGEVDWKKFEAAEGNGAHSGIVWLLGQFQGEQSDLGQSNTEAGRKLGSAFTEAIGVANEIKAHIEKSNSINAAKPSADVVSKWKSRVKAAKNSVLSLSAASGSTASTNSPNPFSRVKNEVAANDTSAQNAQLSSAMQGVQIAQNAVDTAQTNYDNAMKKQQEAQAAMLAVEQKLKSLNDKTKLLENIKVVLRDCIAVLVDLSIQIGKLEKFFSLLTSLIEDIILKKTDVLAEEMGVVAERSYKKKALSMSDVVSQTIYTSTLQSKAYFSMLYDIAFMYVEIDRDHIVPGLDMCNDFSGALAKGTPLAQLQETLRKYNESSGKALQALIKNKQEEIMNGLKDRARAAAESSKAIEATLNKRGIAIDTSAKKAIESGADAARESAQAVLATMPSQTAVMQKRARLSEE